MNERIFIVFELVTYGVFVLMLRHAWTATRGLSLKGTLETKVDDSDLVNRGRWLSTLCWGTVFGVVVELVLTGVSDYQYGKHYLVVFDNFLFPSSPTDKNDVPLSVGVGWGIFLYVTTWTSQRLKLRPLARALYAGLLAVSVDLSLDPSAQLFGLWKWPCGYERTFYDVPFDNFICWLMIVTSYTGLVRLSFTCSWLNRLWGAVVWIPALAAAFSLGFVFVIDHGLEQVHALLKGDLPAFLFFIGIALAIVAHEWHASPPATELRISWPVLTVPLTYPALCWVFLLTSGKWQTHPSLLWVLPLATLGSAIAFAYGSLCRLPTQPGPVAPSQTPPALSLPGEGAAPGVMSVTRDTIGDASPSPSDPF